MRGVEMQNRFPTIDRIHTGAILTEIGERLRIYLSEDQTELPANIQRKLDRLRKIEAQSPSIVPSM
jgi:hypothetical protein